MKAFPNIELTVSEMGQIRKVYENNTGMDLRDYFAIKYVNGIISNPNFDATLSFDEVAKNGYEMADAMMKVRELK
jgi:hypothetical protein